MLLYCSYDNTLSNCSTKHMQVYFVLRKKILQAGILELDTLFSLLMKNITLRYCTLPQFELGQTAHAPYTRIIII